MEVFKTFIDCVLGIFGLVGVFAAIHKPLERKLGGWVAWMNKYPFIKWCVCVGGAMFCLTYIGAAIYIPVQHKKDEKETKKQEEIDQRNLQSNLSQSFLKEIGNVKSQLLDWQVNQQSLLMEIATNTSLPENLRERMIASDAQFEVVKSKSDDLNAWSAGLKGRLIDKRASLEIAHENELKYEESYYQTRITPVFDYAIKTLIDMTGKEAALKGDKVVSNYQGIPPRSNFKQTRYHNVAEIKLQTHTNWSFKADMWCDGSPRPTASLKIGCKGGVMSLDVSTAKVSLNMNLAGTRPFVIFFREDYRKSIDEAVEHLVAAEEEQTGKTNK
jgi:hypothetical protein